MTGGAVVKAASAGAARRLVQSTVVFVVVAASSAAVLLGLTLLTSANAGFLAGFAATHGANVAVTINASKVTATDLARTRHLPGVTQDAGPYPQATITVATGGATRQPAGHGTAAGQAFGHAPSSARPRGHRAAGQPAGGGLPPQQLTVVGRASPGGPLDHVDANPSIMDPFTHGRSRWPSRPGEISLAMFFGIRLSLGSKLTVTSAPGQPKLTVVGYGDQNVFYDDAWVVPSQIAALRAKGAPAQYQMLYTFTDAATTAQVNADVAELRAALPGGTIASSQSWLETQQLTGSQQNVNTPFVLAFAVLALVLAVLIVGNVVSAAVIASYRRIGVLKSIGFTPAQVAGAYLAQIGLPALAGAAAGTVLGDRWVLPVIGLFPIRGEHVSVPVWIDITVPLGMLALTGLAAAVPAVRAGRLSTVAAIAAGQAPRTRHGYVSHRMAGRLPLPRPVTIGLAAPFSRPVRSAVTLAALTFGLTGVVLAAGMYASIHKINYSAIQGLGQVVATARGGQQGTLTPSQNAKILAAMRAQPGTLRYVAQTDLMPGAPASGNGPPSGPGVSGNGRQPPPTAAVGVAGRPKLQLPVYAYNGDSSWLGWNLIRGRWYHGRGEVDASSVLLAATGRAVGDRITLTVNGKPVTVRIAGEVFDPSGLPTLFTSWQTLGGAAAGLAVGQYDIALKPGTSTQAYSGAMDRALGRGYVVFNPAGPSVAAQVDTTWFRLLALLVAVLAALGVLNSVLMATRERVHDLGVFKAVGLTPRQAIAMVACWAVAPAVIAAVIALPAGLILQDALVRQLAASSSTTTGLGGIVLPGSFVHVLSIGDLLLLALAGLGIAAVGALGPASWAAAAKTATALRTE